MKNNLTSTQVLTLSEDTEGYVVYCETSWVDLGCFLVWHGKVIAYASRHLQVLEKNYPTHNLELAVVVFASKIWRYYLYGVNVDVFTNHKILQYVFSKTNLNLQKRRWLERLKHYDMTVLYHPEKSNVVADASSWMYMDSVAHVDLIRKSY